MAKQHSKDSILLIAHGSRQQGVNANIKDFADRWRQRHPDQRIALGFLEASPMSLDAALSKAAEDAQRVIVIPLMLGAAKHVKQDIPHYLAHAQQQHPDVCFMMTKHLGVNAYILKALASEQAKAMRILKSKAHEAPTVILLARGSSDSHANAEIAKLSRLLLEQTDSAWLDIAFSSRTTPSLTTVVQRHIACDSKQIIILPYYLFHGILLQKIKQEVSQLQTQYPNIDFALAKPLAFNDSINELLDKRMREGIAIGSQTNQALR